MSEREIEGLHRLRDDIEEAGLPSPELLARHATEPNALTPEERAQVERAMAPGSPHARVVIDELDTLRGFDFSALDADRREAAEAGWLARGVAWLGGRSALWVAVAAALAIAFWLSRPGALDPGAGEPAPRIAQQDAPAPPPDAVESPDRREPLAPPAPQPPGAEPGEQLAMQPPSESPPPAPVPTPPGADATGPEASLAAQPSPPDATPAPERAPTPTSAPEVAPAPGEVLLAMNLPDYHPAFGRDPLAAGDWIVRGEGADEVGIVVAGPDHLTRTSLASPTLHWSLAKLPSGGVFHLTILDEDDEPVVLDRALPAPTRTGLQRLDLGALGVSLPIGPVLRWSIAWRPSEDAPPASFDFGWLRVVPLDAADAARIAAAPPGERVALLAEAGCFHEALDLALATEARAGATPDVERAITRLLEQAGLAELAASRAGGR